MVAAAAVAVEALDNAVEAGKDADEAVDCNEQLDWVVWEILEIQHSVGIDGIDWLVDFGTTVVVVGKVDAVDENSADCAEEEEELEVRAEARRKTEEQTRWR